MATQRVTRSKTRQQNGRDQSMTNGHSNGVSYHSNGLTHHNNGSIHEANGHSLNGDLNSTNGKIHNGTTVTNGDSNGYVKFEPLQRSSLLNKLFNEILSPLFLVLFSPNFILALWYTATKCDGSFLVFFDHMTRQSLSTGLFNMWKDIQFGNPLIVGIIAGYILFALICMVVLPGPRVAGPCTPKGNVPVYKDNGFYCYWVTLFVFAGLTRYLYAHGMTPTVVYDHFGELLAHMTVLSIFIVIFLQLKGIYWPSSTDCGSSGNPLFDFYWGTELYPRIFGVDIKVFTNCRFGMTVWPLLCLVFALKSYELHGFVDSMWVSCVLQMVYFTKFFWWEAGYMRTIDIMLDRAGFYICWGCLVWVPGLYASVSLYLVNHPVQLGPFWSVAILAVGLVSVWVNYWADEQKFCVRESNGECTIWGRKPDIIRARYTLESGEKRESILLVSGFWGLARHFHYLPELMLAFCWTVPALFENLMPYSYFIFLVILLVHRTYRDDEKCLNKYGPFWKEYSRRVPYRIIPKIY